MTTVTQLIDRALVPMRDGAKTFFGDVEMIAYINEATEDLCARERLIREQADVTTAGGGLPLTADVLQVRWVTDPAGVEVSWMDESTFHSYQEVPWDETTPLATIYDDKVMLHPAPADGQTWKMGYYGLPPVMTAVGDTFPLRRIFERKVVNYMQFKMFNRLDEPGQAEACYSIYLEGLRPAQSVTDHQVPGRVAIAREPNAFDAEVGAIHRGI